MTAFLKAFAGNTTSHPDSGGVQLDWQEEAAGLGAGTRLYIHHFGNWVLGHGRMVRKEEGDQDQFRDHKRSLLKGSARPFTKERGCRSRDRAEIAAYRQCLGVETGNGQDQV